MIKNVQFFIFRVQWINSVSDDNGNSFSNEGAFTMRDSQVFKYTF